MTTNECSFEGCEKAVAVQRLQLCSGHYQQQWKGKELKPLQKKVRFTNPTEDTRICTTCVTVKKLTEFYKRTTGYPHAVCKACMIKNNRQNTLDREAREAATQEQS